MTSNITKSLLDKLGEELDVELVSFFKELETSHKIPAGTIWKKWSARSACEKKAVAPQIFIEAAPSVVVEDKKRKDNSAKKSNYQVFFSIKRSDIMKSTPNASFGEISKQVSAMWKSLPNEEKQKYVSIPEPAITTTTPTPPPKPVIMKKPAEIVFSTAETTKTTPEPKGKRAKVEFSVADDDKEDEEDDFFFPDGSVQDDSDDDDLLDEGDDSFGEED